MTRRHRTPSKRTCFPFVDLPADVQLLVLGNLDIYALQNMIREVPSVKDLFMAYPSIIWPVATTMGPQVRNLLFTTFRLVHPLKSNRARIQPDLGDMQHFLTKNVHTDELDSQVAKMIQSDALGALELLCEIDAGIVRLVQNCAQQFYERACESDNPGAVVPPLTLSRTETCRLTRAFYRLQLFEVLFYHYAAHFGLDLEASASDFFVTLSAFELDELITAYHFLNQNREDLPVTFIWKDCICDEMLVHYRRTREQSCDDCVKAYIRLNAGIIQPFWEQLVRSGCIQLQRPWANPVSSLAKPLTTFSHAPEADEPSPGWRLWSKLRDDPREIVNGNDYMDHFTRLGYCFWDAVRIEDWGEVFSEKWLIEEQDAYRSSCFGH